MGRGDLIAADLFKRNRKAIFKKNNNKYHLERRESSKTWLKEPWGGRGAASEKRIIVFN